MISPLQEVSLLLHTALPELLHGLPNLTASLSHMTDYSVRVSGLRPTGHKSELRVYALEGGAMVDGQELAARLTSLPLHNFGVEDIVLSRSEKATALGSVEVAVLTMACLVFLGAFVAVLCICCIKMKR